MSINSPEQFEKLRACGIIVGKALRAMAAEVHAGVTTAELCEVGSRVLAAHGARSSPPMVYGFPGDVCISVNDEVVLDQISGLEHALAGNTMHHFVVYTDANITRKPVNHWRRGARAVFCEHA